MSIITQKDINSRWDVLPDLLRFEVFSVENDALLEDIANKYSLSDDQYPILANNVLYVLLGFFQPKEIIKRIQGELSLSPQQAMDVFGILDKNIFSRVSDDIRSFSMVYKRQDIEEEDVHEIETQETVSLKQKQEEPKVKEVYIPPTPPSQVGTTSSFQKESSQESIAQKEIRKEPEPQEVSDEPFMIHSTDDVPSQQIQKPRIRRSLGGVSGVFGSSTPSSEKKSNFSEAQVEIPRSEDVKTVHYSDYEPS